MSKGQSKLAYIIDSALQEALQKNGVVFVKKDRMKQICESARLSAEELLETEERAEQAEARMKELEAIVGGLCAYPLCDCGSGPNCRVLDAPIPETCARSDLVEAEAALERAVADGVAMRDVLDRVEAVLSIVEPRSDKHEYLECLGAVRQALTDHPGDKLLAVIDGVREMAAVRRYIERQTYAGADDSVGEEITRWQAACNGVLDALAAYDAKGDG